MNTTNAVRQWKIYVGEFFVGRIRATELEARVHVRCMYSNGRLVEEVR